jgi:hypothetical protein
VVDWCVCVCVCEHTLARAHTHADTLARRERGGERDRSSYGHAKRQTGRETDRHTKGKRVSFYVPCVNMLFFADRFRSQAKRPQGAPR